MKDKAFSDLENTGVVKILFTGALQEDGQMHLLGGKLHFQSLQHILRYRGYIAVLLDDLSPLLDESGFTCSKYRAGSVLVIQTEAVPGEKPERDNTKNAFKEVVEGLATRMIYVRAG